MVQFLSLLLLIVPVSSRELYPWGLDAGDIALDHKISEGQGSEVINLVTKVNFTLGSFNLFGLTYSSALVNKQGIISFEGDTSESLPTPYYQPHPQLSHPLPGIFPFLAEVDPDRGTLYYRETNQGSLLSSATADIRAGFPALKDLNLGWALVVTWSALPFWEPSYYYAGAGACNCTPRTNTFQALLATTAGGHRSFVVFNYGKLSWAKNPWSRGDWMGAKVLMAECPAIPANIGAFTGFSYGSVAAKPLLTLDGSFSDNLLMNLTNSSNVGVAGNKFRGKWVFRTDGEVVEWNSCEHSNTLEKISITPNHVCQLGHISLKIRGPVCLSNIRTVDCRYFEESLATNSTLTPTAVTTGTVSVSTAESFVTCPTPIFQVSSARVRLELVLSYNGLPTEDKSYTGYFYTQPPSPGNSSSSLYLNIRENGEVYFKWNSSLFPSPSSLLEINFVELDWLARSTKLEANDYKMTVANTGEYTMAFKQEQVQLFKNLGSGYFGFVRNTHVGLEEEDVYLYSRIIYTRLSGSKEDFGLLCDQWFAKKDGPPENLPICPPTLEHASIDWNFRPEMDPNNVNPTFRQSVASSRGGCQRCAYNPTNGALLLGATQGGATAFVACPSGPLGLFNHHEKDLLPLHWCAAAAGGPSTSLAKYYQRRTSPATGVYAPPKIGLFWGDPHFQTWDGTRYTFNPIGEFWVIKSPGFDLQGRIERLKNTNVSIFTAFAFRAYEQRFQVNLQATGLELRLDGEEIQTFGADRIRVTRNESGIEFFRSEGRLRVNFPGFGFEVMAFTWGEAGLLNSIGQISPQLRGMGVGGLLGDFDGNSSNDYKTPENGMLTPNAGWTEIHRLFGEKWRVKMEESLFLYVGRESHASFQNPDFVPNFTPPSPKTIASFPPRLLELCGGEPNCLFDFAASGSIAIANGTRTTQQMAGRMEAIFKKMPCQSPPCIEIEPSSTTVKGGGPPTTPHPGQSTTPKKSGAVAVAISGGRFSFGLGLALVIVKLYF